MRLSEYIERLRAIQRECRRAGGLDPEVAISRYSDLTTGLSADGENLGEDGQPLFPRLAKVAAATHGGAIRPTTGWRQRHHPSMGEDAAELVVELADGN